MSSATVQTTGNSRTAARTDDGNHAKFLTFCLGNEEYGLPILVAREIIGIIDVTPLPQTPTYVKGVINLRGKIIPVIELRAKFGIPSVGYTQETCILVVEVAAPSGGGSYQLGVIVDSVSEVLDISRDNIEPAPSFGGEIPVSAILGMGKVKNKVVILLDINAVGSAPALEKLATGANESHQDQPALATAA